MTTNASSLGFCSSTTRRCNIFLDYYPIYDGATMGSFDLFSNFSICHAQAPEFKWSNWLAWWGTNIIWHIYSWSTMASLRACSILRHAHKSKSSCYGADVYMFAPDRFYPFSAPYLQYRTIKIYVFHVKFE